RIPAHAHRRRPLGAGQPELSARALLGSTRRGNRRDHDPLPGLPGTGRTGASGHLTHRPQRPAPFHHSADGNPDPARHPARARSANCRIGPPHATTAQSTSITARVVQVIRISNIRICLVLDAWCLIFSTWYLRYASFPNASIALVISA